MAETPCEMKIHVDMEPVRNICELVQIFSDVQDEIRRAREKHGVQHHLPMGTGPGLKILDELDDIAEANDLPELIHMTNAQLEQAAKLYCQETGDTWSKILFEEVTETLAATDRDLDAELVQTIAMGVSMLQAHRRQRAAANREAAQLEEEILG